MTAPASYDRVLALLRRLSPSWPSTESDTSVGKELGSIATALGTAADPLDGALDEVFPDTTDELIDRWEKVCRVPTRTTDDLDVRRSRVLSVLRRTNGPQLTRLATMLAGPLDIDAEDIGFLEGARIHIDEALTVESGTLTLASPAVASLGKPWPGEVDDTGVRVYIDVNTISGSTVTLTSPSGTSWAITLTSTAAWYWDRETFTGETAGGKWTLSYTAAGGTLTSWKLIVSNDVDAGQIYNFYAYRDPDLDGDPDITEAQRLFRRTALAQMWSFVIESLDFACDDEHSLCDRDPLGD